MFDVNTEPAWGKSAESAASNGEAGEGQVGRVSGVHCDCDHRAEPQQA